MKPTIRAVLAVGLMVLGLASGVPTPALAARTITLTSLTVTAQAKGEITLLGTVGDADDTATVEQYAAGQWRQVATAEPGDDDTFLTTVSADTAGFAYFRASLPASGDQPAVTSSAKPNQASRSVRPRSRPSAATSRSGPPCRR
jgi:hypothetical protein